MTNQLVPTITDMVSIVNNIIQGYDMGPIRALAQEPVQNSIDAARNRRSVVVEYRLHARNGSDGSQSYLLTVTDANTTGLRGQPRQLTNIESNQGYLSDGENWAAFEGMGYTKKPSDDSLGSRGQGKAAFLYHSDLNIILYDTLLESGEYRLGARHARPHDSVLSPPFEGDEARTKVTTTYAHPTSGQEVSLELDPLQEIGTRIIVPNLSQEAVEAFHSGELDHWLQRCWWRAIQTGLTIRLVDEHGEGRSVTVPTWWRDDPWNQPSRNLCTQEYISAAPDLQIKRVVLLYDEALTEPDIANTTPQFWGVQLLRGQQWIETPSEFLEYIPRDRRPGFRGFVEFDSRTEGVLHRAEKPQHERFDRRAYGVKPLINAIEEEVRRFAEAMGWSSTQRLQPAPDREREAAFEFLRFFNPRARRQSLRNRGAHQLTLLGPNNEPAPSWSCDLHMAFPDGHTARADWGSNIRSVSVDVGVVPAGSRRPPTVHLFLTSDVNPNDRRLVAQQDVEMWNGVGGASFGDFEVIRGNSSAQHLPCTEPGKWKLSAEVVSARELVAKDSRSFFVQEDPPPRSPKPYTISISTENLTSQRRRFDNDDLLGIQISVKNREAEDVTLRVDASLEHELLADGVTIAVAGTPPGATPKRIAALQDTLVMVTSEATWPSAYRAVTLPAGQHRIRADLRIGEEIVAHAEKTIDIEVDPIRNDDWPPFDIEQRSDGVHPRYEFRMDGEDWTLQYPNGYPLYRLLSTQLGGAHGGEAFIVDACAEGLVEWTLFRPSEGDDSRLDEFLGWELPQGLDPQNWERVGEKLLDLQGLINRGEDWAIIGKRQRECAALLLALFEERQ